MALSHLPQRNHNPRTHLRPIHRGPWLEDRSAQQVWRWMVGLGVLLTVGSACCVMFLLWWHQPPPGVVPSRRYQPSGAFMLPLIGGVIFLVSGGFAGLIAAACPRVLQLCPKCLSSMRYGATVCPKCHFTPAPQEDDAWNASSLG
jgi:hypothetical protein